MPTSPRVPPVDPVPAVLRLVQSAVLGRFRTSTEPLYRELASLVAATDADGRREVLVSGCGDGRSVRWLADRTSAVMTGVDPDGARVEAATSDARSNGSSATFQQAPLDDLPFDDAVFDAAIGEPILTGAGDPARAVSELVRVVRPMAPVVVCQFTWNTDFDAGERAAVITRLGLSLRHLVEWKKLLREAGLVDLEVQDWTDLGRSRERGNAPAFTLAEKLQIAGRAWRRWGWRAAREAVGQETALLQDLARERAIGFHLLYGVKWPHARADKS